MKHTKSTTVTMCCAMLLCYAMLSCAMVGFTVKDTDNVPTRKPNPQFMRMQAMMRQDILVASISNTSVDETSSKPKEVVIKEYLERCVTLIGSLQIVMFHFACQVHETWSRQDTRIRR